MKTIKGLLGCVGFGVSAIISQGRQSLGPGIWRSLKTGAAGKQGSPPVCSEETPEESSPGSYCHWLTLVLVLNTKT